MTAQDEHRQAPTIDLDLAARNLGGDAGLVGRIFDSFLRHQAEDIACLCEACCDEDWSRARRLAHTLKGAAASIGAEALERQASVFEEHCIRLQKNPDDTVLESLETDLQALQKSHRQVLSELETHGRADSLRSTQSTDATDNDPAPILEELCERLKQFDIAAVDLWDDQGVSLALPGADSLEKALAAYDFETALAEARKLLQQYHRKEQYQHEKKDQPEKKDQREKQDQCESRQVSANEGV